MPSNDVFPSRNLGPAEHWGRKIEDRLRDVGKYLEQYTQGITGANRYAAASAADLASIVTKTKALAGRVEASIVGADYSFSANGSRSGFPVSTSWNTVATARITPPSGTTRMDLIAQATAWVVQDGTVGEDFKWPFSLSSVSSEFGSRAPLPFHRGIDFSQAGGSFIPSASTGQIILRAYYDDWGNYVRVDCSELTGVSGSWLGYAHLQSPAPWSVGDTILQSQTVGLVGTTGYSTGNHLHFETALGGERMNPRTFMDIFGGSSSAPAVKIQGRLVIAGVASIAFDPPLGGFQQAVYPIDGQSLPNPGPVDVHIQLRALGSALPSKTANRALVSVQGGFLR